jgi:hypothetical protein
MISAAQEISYYVVSSLIIAIKGTPVNSHDGYEGCRWMVADRGTERPSSAKQRDQWRLFATVSGISVSQVNSERLERSGCPRVTPDLKPYSSGMPKPSGGLSESRRLYLGVLVDAIGNAASGCFVDKLLSM